MEPLLDPMRTRLLPTYMVRGMRELATALVAVLACGCIKAVAPPPTLGYGPPYGGNGQGIYIKDSRTDWAISEGETKITSEQALEASKDPEYEARRQVAKAHNDVLYREGLAHRTRGTKMIRYGVATAIAGLIFGAIVPRSLEETTTTAATVDTPELRDKKAGGATKLTAFIAYAAVFGGVGLASYGYLGGKRPPPYYSWHTPKSLDRPSYVRQHTEEYNEKIGAASIQGQPDDNTPAPLAPGQRRLAPPGAH